MKIKGRGKMQKRLALGMLSLAGLVVILLVSGLLPSTDHFHGSVMNPAYPAPDFQLVDTQGKNFQLSAQKGSAVVLFFGYTNCPDICPMTMATYRNVIEALKGQASQVRFVFVTVDPARDTTQQISLFLNRFHPAIVGLTGSAAQLQQAWQGYGVYAQGSTVGNGIDHSDQIYLIDPKGMLRVIYPNDVSAADLQADILRVLKGK